MPSPPPSPAHSEPEKTYTFAVALTVYSTLKKKTKTKVASTTTKEEKSIKTKELLFAVNDTNYIDFLQSILDKHGRHQYRVSMKKRFPFKFMPPGIKTQRANDARDVDNEGDYQEMVMKILSAANPDTTKVFVDMKHVEKLSSAHHSGDDNGDTTSDANAGNQSLSLKALDLDARLSRWRIKLQKRYKNEHDEGLTYVGPMGPVPLTLAMILDWCRSLDEGQATLIIPPNIESFNIANKVPFLHPARKAQVVQPQPSAPVAMPGVDVNSLMSVLLLQMISNSNASSASLLHPVAVNAPAAIGSAPPVPAPAPVAPVTPTRKPAEAHTSPPLPSPSQLRRFLRYAETHLGVAGAVMYEHSLDIQGIGPDILPKIGDDVLTGFGISMGDIIHLKEGSKVWWNGPEAKRKRSNTDDDGIPLSKKVAYEKRYHDGGACRFSGPPMQQDDGADMTNIDYKVYYKCSLHNQWLPVPQGFTVNEEGDDNDGNQWH